MRCSVAPITRDDSLDGGLTAASIFPCRATATREAFAAWPELTRCPSLPSASLKVVTSFTTRGSALTRLRG